MKKEHLFDNGVKVYDHQLLPIQRERYKSRNVHEEEEEDLFVKIIGGLHKDAVYVSVGTAIGYYPLLAKRLKNDINVHCFEPLPLHLEYLKENMELNGWRHPRFPFMTWLFLQSTEKYPSRTNHTAVPSFPIRRRNR